MEKNAKILIIIVLAAVVALAGFLAYKTFFQSAAETENVFSDSENRQTEVEAEVEAEAEAEESVTSNQNSQNVPAPAPKKDAVMPGFKLYKNVEFGFEIQYMQTWAVSEENIVNVRGENTKAFYFKKPNSDLRFAILPRDGLSYGLPDNGTSDEVTIGGSVGVQRKWTLDDGRRLWILNPQHGLHNWSEDIGRIDILSSASDPEDDTAIFEQMLNSFKLVR